MLCRISSLFAMLVALYLVGGLCSLSSEAEGKRRDARAPPRGTLIACRVEAAGR